MLQQIRAVFKIVILSMLTIFVAACAAGPAVENYPTRTLDRPYVVPEGLALWQVDGLHQVERNENSWHADDTTYLSLMIWETHLADGWSLLWYPIPAGVGYQAWNDEDSRLGFRALLGFGYGESQGWTLSPRFDADYRYKFLNDFAFDVSTTFVPRIAFKKGTPYRWDFSSSLGPLWQVTNFTALRTSFVYTAKRDIEYQLYDSSDVIFYHSGFELATSFAMTKQTTVEPSYRYLSGGSGYRDHEYRLSFLHVW